MTDHELIEFILLNEFPDLKRARSIHNPFADFSWVLDIPEPERSQEWFRLRAMVGAILMRERELQELDDDEFVILRKRYGVEPDNEPKRTKKKGRPIGKLDPLVRRQDEVIARTAQWLVIWGFPRRSVYRAISKQIPSIFPAAELRQKPISWNRVEQIHEAWQIEERAVRARRSGVDLSFQRSRYTAESLYRACPNKLLRLPELTFELLKNGGKWPSDWVEIPFRQADLTPKALAEMELMLKVAKRKRGN